MKKNLIQIYSWAIVILFFIDLSIIFLLCVTIVVSLLTPFIILVGIPLMISELWKKKH